MDNHPLAVDVTDLQMSRFGSARASGIQRHQQDAMKGELSRVDQTRNPLLAEYLRKMKDPSSDRASRQCSSFSS
jgi:hypothetical protein